MIKSALVHFDDHFNPYLHCFQRQTRAVKDAAKRCLHGLFQSDRRNMEQMAESVIVGMLAGARYGYDAIPRRWLKALDESVLGSCEQQAASLLHQATSQSPDAASV